MLTVRFYLDEVLTIVRFSLKALLKHLNDHYFPTWAKTLKCSFHYEECQRSN